MRTWLGGALVALAVLADAAAADALRGQVVAPDHTPLAGTTVVASGPALVGTQAEITDEDGRFTMELPTGTYLITFYYADRQTERRDVQLAPAGTAVVNVVLDPTPSSEVIVVDDGLHCCGGESCSSRNFAGTTITDEYLKNVPVPAPAPAAKPAPAHGCAHCASGGGDAPVGLALLVSIALGWTRRGRRA